MKPPLAAVLCAAVSSVACSAELRPDPRWSGRLLSSGPLLAGQSSQPPVAPAATATPPATARRLAHVPPPTYTYMRCYYRDDDDGRLPATRYVWARDKAASGSGYYRLEGSWWSDSAFGWENMFYVHDEQKVLRNVCETTLREQGIARPLADLYAANNELSFNYTVWSNAKAPAADTNAIERVIAFGDSLSDTQNMYNASTWRLPNPQSWYLGRFSNGPVWVEYLAGRLDLPLYNWAVGGAAGDTSYGILPGLKDQVASWRQYMKRDHNYRPETSLFTVLIGGNDLVNYGRPVDIIVADVKAALRDIIAAGGRHILLLNLPDVTRAPLFAQRKDKSEVAAQVAAYNAQLDKLVEQLMRQDSTLDLQLFDTHRMFEDIFAAPSGYRIANTVNSCLQIDQPTVVAYTQHRTVRAACVRPETYVFWDTMHPTTHTHQLLAERVLAQLLSE